MSNVPLQIVLFLQATHFLNYILLINSESYNSYLKI